MFFAPWCGHCKRLKPTWHDLAKKYNIEGSEEGDPVIASVDCTVETALCSAQDVTGYPTLKFFKSGKDSGVKHRGQRDKDALVKFIDQQLGRAPTDEEEFAALPEVAVAEEGLYVLTQKSFAKHIEKGDTLIKFYAPWCGHCKKLAPVWDSLAKAIEADKTITATVAKLDCTQAQSVCQENGVKGYPTLAYFRNGEKLETYSGGRTQRELEEFIRSMKPSEEGQVPKGEEAPVETKVLSLDADTFENSIKSGLTLVKFFAPWCGHCKRMAPTWEQLGEKFADVEGVQIAKVDCTAEERKNMDLCNEQKVNGFPTLIIYRDGAKVDEYRGKRTLEDLEKFVNEHQTAQKDEL